MRKDTSGKFVLTLLIVGFVASVVLLVGFKLYTVFTSGRGPSPVVAAGGLALDKADFAAFERGSDATSMPAAGGETEAIGQGVLDRPVRIAIASRGSIAPGLLAARAGKEGGLPAIEWVRLEDRLARYDALGSGKVDLVWDTLDGFAAQVVRLDSLKYQARVVLFLGFSRGADGIVARGTSGDLSALRRQTLAVPGQDPAHFLSLYLLGNSDLTPAEKSAFVSRTYLTADSAQALTLWQEGRSTAVGGAATRLPAESPDSSPVVRWDTTLAPRLVSEVLVANPELIEKAPRTLEALAKGWLEGVAAVAENPVGAQDALAAGLEVAPDEAARLLDGVALADAPAQAQFFGSKGGAAGEGAVHLDAAQAIWKELGTVGRTVPGAGWLDGRFALAAAREVADLPEPQAFLTRSALKTRSLHGKPVALTFTADGTRLTAGAERTLSALGASLKTFREARLGIAGLEAPEGSRPRRMADVVVKQLSRSHGVESSRLIALPVPTTPATLSAVDAGIATPGADAGAPGMDGGAGDAGALPTAPAAPSIQVELRGG